MVVVRVPISNSANRDDCLPVRCTMERHDDSGWYVVLHDEVQEWCDALGIRTVGRIGSYRFGSFEFENIKDARTFMLVWL